MKAPVLFLLALLTSCQTATDTIPTDQTPLPGDAYPTLTVDGAWCWFSDPRAVHSGGKTFAGWVNSRGDIVVAQLDDKTGKRDTALIVAELEADDHNNPAILLDEAGRLELFFAKHARADPLLHISASKVGEIDAWGEKEFLYLNDTVRYGGFSNTYTYTYPSRLSQENDRNYLCWRGADFKPNISRETDGAWPKGRILILPERKYQNRRPYLKTADNGRDILHFAFTDGHPRDEPTNSIYYMQYRQDTFRRAGGAAIKAYAELPVAPAEADLVYDAPQTNERAWIWDVAEDKNGHPVLVYARFADETHHQYWYAWHDGQQWHNKLITEAGQWFPHTPDGKVEPEPHYSGGVTLDHDQPNVVYLSRPVNGVFEIERHVFEPATQTFSSTAVTTNSRFDNVRPVVPRGHQQGAGPQVLWMLNEQYVHYTDYRSRIKYSSLVH